MFPNAARSSSTVSTDGMRKLRKISELCIQNPEFVVKDKVYNILYDREIYYIAYNKLKSKPGNMTPGITPTTPIFFIQKKNGGLDGMSSEVIENIINKMKDSSFKFSPGRRINIPKPSGHGTRPLTIAPPRDKVIQEVMRMILESIFEPSFLPNSHGFRPGKSCHSALRDLKTNFQLSKWMIEGDISQCFPSINHHKLVDLISARVKDHRFIELI